MLFTAHNILLNNGEMTISNNAMLKDAESCKAIIRTLNMYFRDRPRSSIRIADLGCLEGGYSVEFARNGYEVLGIEAREANIKKCLYVASNLNLPNLKFIQDDVKNIQKYGSFDVVFCCGLLYHLDKPCSFLKLLGSITSHMLILHTHYSLGSRRSVFGKYPLLGITVRVPLIVCKRFFKRLMRRIIKFTKEHYYLSGVCLNEGKLGRWAYEYLPWSSRDEIDTKLWASYSNHLAFWPSKKDLLQTIKESGFDLVYEQYDFLGDISRNTYIEDHNRSLFVGIKTALLKSDNG